MIRYVNFVLTHHNAKAPVKKYKSDAGWDLFVSRDTTVGPGETVDIHTDIRVNLPPFTFARLTGRSSTLRKHNLMVNEGIIDNEFTGELFICVRNMSRTETFEVKAGMRLAQVLFHKIEDIRWSEVGADNFKATPRGDSGFGSTGLFEVDHTR